MAQQIINIKHGNIILVKPVPVQYTAQSISLYDRVFSQTNFVIALNVGSKHKLMKNGWFYIGN